MNYNHKYIKYKNKYLKELYGGTGIIDRIINNLKYHTNLLEKNIDYLKSSALDCILYNSCKVTVFDYIKECITIVDNIVEIIDHLKNSIDSPIDLEKDQSLHDLLHKIDSFKQILNNKESPRPNTFFNKKLHAYYLWREKINIEDYIKKIHEVNENFKKFIEFFFTKSIESDQLNEIIYQEANILENIKKFDLTETTLGFLESIKTKLLDINIYKKYIKSTQKNF